MSDDIVNAYRAEVAKQVRVQAAKWLIGLLVILFLAAATGWWFYLKPKIDDYIRQAGGLPPGAVVAFNSSQTEPCPGPNWTLFDAGQGRMIVGAGHNASGREEGLTPKVLGKTGGKESLQLSENNVPIHGHAAGTLSINNNEDFIHRTEKRAPLTTQATAAGLPASPFPLFALDPGNLRNFGHHSHKIVGKTADYGGSEPVDTMPPYVALYFCVKT